MIKEGYFADWIVKEVRKYRGDLEKQRDSDRIHVEDREKAEEVKFVKEGSIQPFLGEIT